MTFLNITQAGTILKVKAVDEKKTRALMRIQAENGKPIIVEAYGKARDQLVEGASVIVSGLCYTEETQAEGMKFNIVIETQMIAPFPADSFYSHVTFFGRLYQPIEVKQTNNGLDVTKFSLGFTTKQGTEYKNSYIECQAWRGNATGLAQYVPVKGFVTVFGTLSWNTWEKAGVKNYRPLITISKYKQPAKALAEAINENGSAPAQSSVPKDEWDFVSTSFATTEIPF